MVDADSNTPLLHDRDGPAGRSAYGLDEELAKTLVHTLEPVVGPEHVRASVHVEYDLGTSEDTQETYDPKTTATLTQQHAEETSSGGAPAGIPGTASNIPASTAATAAPPTPAPGAAPNAAASATPAAASSVAAATAPTSDQSSSRSDSTTFAVSKTMHHSVEPPGRVRRIAAAVLVDDAVEVTEVAGKRTTTRRKRTVDEMKQIEQLARRGHWNRPATGRRAGGRKFVVPGTAGRSSCSTHAHRTLAHVDRALVVELALCGAGRFVSGDLLDGSASGETASSVSVPPAAQPALRPNCASGRGRGPGGHRRSSSRSRPRHPTEASAYREGQGRARGGKPPGADLGAARGEDSVSAPPGLRKAAILLVVLGEDAASQIYRHLSQNEVEQVTQEIAGMKQVTAETVLTVLEEFDRMVLTGDYLAQGGREYANKLLVKAFGEEGARQLLQPGIAVGRDERGQTGLAAESRPAAAGQVH